LGPLLGNNPFHHFIGEAFEATPFNPQVMGISISVALAGLALGWLLYGRNPLVAGQTDPLERLGPLWVILKNKYWIDEIYNATLVRGTIFLADLLFAFDLGVIDGLVNLAGKATVAFSTLNRLFDTYIIDGAVNGVGWLARALGRQLRLIQTGRVQNYLLLLLLSVLLLTGLFIYQ
jgi:NADH-quinone oxidoreductase subunit L